MTDRPTRAAQGRWAEAEAERYLANKGFIFIQRNFRTKTGEIDLIMHDENTLVFIEVRYRKNNDFGGGLASVDKRKQIKLTRTAECYLAWHKKYAKMASRFDVVSISANKLLPKLTRVNEDSSTDSTSNLSAEVEFGMKCTIEWIKNAF